MRLEGAYLNMTVQPDGKYLVDATVFFIQDDQQWAKSVKFVTIMRTGDPRLNGQMEELCLKAANRILAAEKDPNHHARLIK